MNQRLYRSRDDRILFGIAGGLADQFNIDPSLIRILWVVLALLTAGAAVVLYIAMAFIVPEEPAGDSRWAGWQASYDGSQRPGDTAAAAPATGPTPTSPTGTASGSTPAASFVDPTRSGQRLRRREAGPDGRGALFLGLILTLVGGYFLVRAYVPAADVDRAWPILIVIVGVVCLAGSVRRSAGPSA
jgi:phage shock protein C